MIDVQVNFLAPYPKAPPQKDVMEADLFNPRARTTGMHEAGSAKNGGRVANVGGRSPSMCCLVKMTSEPRTRARLALKAIGNPLNDGILPAILLTTADMFSINPGFGSLSPPIT